MESKLLKELSEFNNKINFFDGRESLTTNSSGKKWRTRNVDKLKGMVWHQELGFGTVEQVAKYHTGKNSHLYEGGVESISYSMAIRKNGQIVLCNELNKATWSQGYAKKIGDENADYLSVMFEGYFKGEGVTDENATEPTEDQILSGLILWKVCKKIWNWSNLNLYGHYNYGKPACPGNTLKTIIKATNINFVIMDSKEESYNFNSIKDRQKALLNLKYYTGTPDGIWGPASKGSLVQFQLNSNLEADGIWGSKTEKAIQKLLQKD